MENIAEQYILTKYSKCNTVQVTRDLINNEYLKIAIASYAISYQSAILPCYN